MLGLEVVQVNEGAEFDGVETVSWRNIVISLKSAPSRKLECNRWVQQLQKVCPNVFPVTAS